MRDEISEIVNFLDFYTINHPDKVRRNGYFTVRQISNELWIDKVSCRTILNDMVDSGLIRKMVFINGTYYCSAKPMPYEPGGIVERELNQQKIKQLVHERQLLVKQVDDLNVQIKLLEIKYED